ncbi:Lsm12p [Kluyveromyces lactis]|uniref:KLLA0F24266p n=1 Tax=Kluyveromyces lactis (strain ATCC 8585 / CBS 2359 / DSM 70799 / NBRC 1267 / NRRL Y-1140 / WM37) TaxID=284590 RepID=Q6CIS8_KLULA|nr:uncharacterized protein KLLA0_F24266g [Kluyveromyces lactis]CAG98869.1 KLLA0F24266p [Kluyveromyces lactis]|eukprot:XP_456161.1 uncharacterized protein KLLA0_F24266g [Kluyveromyces lactis]
MSISLENILGLKVKITDVLDHVTQGKVYSFNSNNDTITLIVGKKNKAYTFEIIQTSFIKHLELVGEKANPSSFKKDHVKPSYVDLDRVKNALAKTIDTAAKKEMSIGKNVSYEGQFIFDLIHKTISDIVWKGKSIVVLDELEINPPYQLGSIKPLQGRTDVKSKELIDKIVESAWNKLENERKGG